MLVCGIGAATVTNFLKAKSHFCYTKAGKGMANCRLCCQKKRKTMEVRHSKQLQMVIFHLFVLTWKKH